MTFLQHASLQLMQQQAFWHADLVSLYTLSRSRGVCMVIAQDLPA